MSEFSNMRCLVVEDEPAIADTLVYTLESEGYEVKVAGRGHEALQHVAEESWDAVVLDVGLPDLSGFEVCRRIRQEEKGRSLPLLFLTARSEEVDRIVGLEIGADDYLTKPFSPRELVARLRALWRRCDWQGQPKDESAEHAQAKEELESQPSTWRLEEEGMRIFYHDVELPLSALEFRLLATLLRHPGRVFSRMQLMEAAWEEPEAALERTVDAHVKSVRAKLRDIMPDDDPIETRRGLGYALAVS